MALHGCKAGLSKRGEAFELQCWKNGWHRARVNHTKLDEPGCTMEGNNESNTCLFWIVNTKKDPDIWGKMRSNKKEGNRRHTLKVT